MLAPVVVLRVCVLFGMMMLSTSAVHYLLSP